MTRLCQWVYQSQLLVCLHLFPAQYFLGESSIALVCSGEKLAQNKEIVGFTISKACGEATCLKQTGKYRNCKFFIFRYSFNVTAAGFVFIGTLWDIGTWYYAKDLKIFDELEEEDT